MAKPAAVSTPLCSILHELRTAENSGGYFQPKLGSLKEANPNLKLLDVGSGWGHMGCSLARALGPEGGVVGVDINPESLAHAREVAERCGLHERVEFVEGDAYKLPFPDNEFDVAHCHQVLAHLEKPWDVIREMMRVTRPGGFVAIREGDLESEIVYPPEPGLLKFHKLIATAMTARGKGGGGADSGRQLLPWALRAGAKRDQITVSYGTWWFDTPEHKDKWGKQTLISLTALWDSMWCSNSSKVLTFVCSQGHGRTGERRDGR